MTVSWTTKYRAPGVAFETDGQLYGKYVWRTDGRVEERATSALLAVTKDQSEASGAVAAREAGEAPSMELVRIERLVRPTYNVLGTNMVVREDEEGVKVLRHGHELVSVENIAAVIEWLAAQ
jgi:hypothetical protein